jgi:hypothetical protein
MVRRWRLIGYFRILYNPQPSPCIPSCNTTGLHDQPPRYPAVSCTPSSQPQLQHTCALDDNPPHAVPPCRTPRTPPRLLLTTRSSSRGQVREGVGGWFGRLNQCSQSCRHMPGILIRIWLYLWTHWVPHAASVIVEGGSAEGRDLEVGCYLLAKGSCRGSWSGGRLCWGLLAAGAWWVKWAPLAAWAPFARSSLGSPGERRACTGTAGSARSQPSRRAQRRPRQPSPRRGEGLRSRGSRGCPPRA